MLSFESSIAIAEYERYIVAKPVRSRVSTQHATPSMLFLFHPIKLPSPGLSMTLAAAPYSWSTNRHHNHHLAITRSTSLQWKVAHQQKGAPTQWAETKNVDWNLVKAKKGKKNGYPRWRNNKKPKPIHVTSKRWQEKRHQHQHQHQHQHSMKIWFLPNPLNR